MWTTRRDGWPRRRTFDMVGRLGSATAVRRVAEWEEVSMSNESILVILLVGLIAGWLAGQIVKGTGYGLVADICIGIIGALIGSWLLPSWASTSASASFRPSSWPPSVPLFSWSFCGSLTAAADGDSSLRLVRSLHLRTADLADRPAQAGDQFPAASEVGCLGGENRREPSLLERQHVDPIRFGIGPCRVAHDVDEPVKRVQAAEEIIVFA